MIERLKVLSRPLRFATYLAGLLLIIMTAVGVGAAAAAMVNWQSGRVATDSAEPRRFESSNPVATGPDTSAEDTGIEESGGSASPSDAGNKAPFIHEADRANSRENYTYISEPSIDGDADAIVIVSFSPPADLENGGAASYGHNFGVWYEPVANQWAIFDQDRSPVPAGASFRVVVPQASVALVHRSSLSNTVANYTYIDDQLTNGKPDIVLQVTQNWNPGGRGGVYNDHPVDTLYDPDVKEWAIYNRDGAPIPEGACFNVAVSAGDGDSNR